MHRRAMHGCMACANACGRQAITFKVNDEGFYRPQINTDSCVSCMSCEKVCPILSPAKAFHSTMGKVFAAWHKDTEVRKESSSGGAFSALAENNYRTEWYSGRCRIYGRTECSTYLCNR